MVEGDLFRAADLHALADFEGAHEARRLDQRIRRAGVEPGEAAAHALDVERARFEIDAVEVGDLVLAARRGLERLAISTTLAS